MLAIPRGNKPLRTEVDFSEWGAGVCNAVADYETARLWGNMGLGHMYTSCSVKMSWDRGHERRWAVGTP